MVLDKQASAVRRMMHPILFLILEFALCFNPHSFRYAPHPFLCEDVFGAHQRLMEYMLHSMCLYILLLTLNLVPAVVCPSTDAPLTTFQTEEDMLRSYVTAGYTYATIQAFLATYHGIQWSIATLKRKFKRYRLGHRINRDGQGIVDANILEELRGTHCQVGYRSMWKILKQQRGLSVSRATVMRRLRLLDPQGTRRRTMGKLQRRSYYCPGPNHTWHADGYDKLKPWGFCIHGAIDGFSRKILWLEVGHTNNDPRVTANYYLTTVSTLRKCPNTLVTDCGTENCRMATMNVFFRGSQKYVTSVRNQRIEAWWSSFRRSHMQCWLNLFHGLYDAEVYDPDLPFQKSCMQYCMMGILQRDLDGARDLWNSHRIRPSNAPCPSGVPDEMYYLPGLFQTRDYAIPVNARHLGAMQVEVSAKQLCADPVVREYCDLFRQRRGIDMPLSIQGALNLYRDISMAADA